MANLANDRILSSRLLQEVRIGFGEPFKKKSSRIHKAPIIKGYLTLKRFISRRGNPNVIYSDNATTQ